MTKQTLGQQFLYGAAFGVIIVLTNLYNEHQPILSAYGIGSLIGGLVFGPLLYCLAYRLWPKK